MNRYQQRYRAQQAPFQEREHCQVSLRGVNDRFHDAEGNVKVVSLTDGGKILRLENFKSTNRPNVHVYLATDKPAADYIDLEKL